MAVHRVDRSSGQVYTETSMAPALSLSRGTSWVHESPFPPIGWEETSERGSPSLKHSAMMCVLSDQRVLTPEVFATVPWHIANYLWDCLGRSKKRTFYMWKLFVTVYPRQFRERSLYRSMKIEGPKMPMRDYLGLVKSETLSWRLVLTVAAEFARVPELVEITILRNLVALEIISPPRVKALPDDTEVSMTTLNDRVIRTWSELAQSSGAFAHLRILRLHHQKDLSAVALRYMKAFPSLRFMVIHNCPGLTSNFSDDCTDADGWEIADIPELVESTSLYNCYTVVKDLEEKDPSTMSEDIPVLDFQLGQTTHRVDRRSRIRSQPILCLRRGSSETDTPQPVSKKVKLDEKNPSRRAVMKERGGDLGGMLGELMVA